MTESRAQPTDVTKVLHLSDMCLCVCHKDCRTKFNVALAGLHSCTVAQFIGGADRDVFAGGLQHGSGCFSG